MRVLFLSPFLAQEPLGIMYISGALKSAGHETKLIFVPDANLEEKVREFDAGVVCYSFTTGVHPMIVGLNQRIKKIIEGEDARKPLSDSKIVNILQKEGLILARRTIAKYREELKIPTSNQRKVLY